MASLKSRFEELIHLEWDEFCELEQSDAATVDDSVLCSLIRTCSDTDEIAAIKLAFDRIEGLQETQIEIKVPKFYKRYLNAKEVEAGTAQLEAPKEATDAPSSYDPATARLRETLREMRRLPHEVVPAVLRVKLKVEKAIEANIEIPRGTPDSPKIPKVKAVIVANLLRNVQKGKFKAVELVFDQIDGKLPKAIQLLGGDDIYVDDTETLIAPVGSMLDEHGVYYSEDKVMTTQWLRGFAQSQKGLEMLAEGLDDEG